jgi:hypothetical protein
VADGVIVESELFAPPHQRYHRSPCAVVESNQNSRAPSPDASLVSCHMSASALSFNTALQIGSSI